MNQIMQRPGLAALLLAMLLLLGQAAPRAPGSGAIWGRPSGAVPGVDARSAATSTIDPGPRTVVRETGGRFVAAHTREEPLAGHVAGPPRPQRTRRSKPGGRFDA